MCHNERNYRMTFRNNDKLAGTYSNPRFAGITLPDNLRGKKVKIVPEFVSIYVPTSHFSSKESEYIQLNLRGTLFENNFKNENNSTTSNNNIAILDYQKVSGSNNLYKFSQNNVSQGVQVNMVNFNFDMLEFEFRDANNGLVADLSGNLANYIIVLNFIILE